MSCNVGNAWNSTRDGVEMKRILITGANSYIGTSFENYMKQWPNDYQVYTLDMIGDGWKKADFSRYDVVFHVAGIAHQKETKENSHLYYEINRDLAVDVARKAKEAGVHQFIFLSSMSVYGMDVGVITEGTKPNPKSNYGKSKLQAEERMASLCDERFWIATLRPPMVYGDGCKGNYQSIIKIVRKLPVFPRVNNQRSMIYIDKLSAFIKMVVDNEWHGLYLPQNDTYTNTSEMAQNIAVQMGKKIYLSYLLGLGVVVLRPFSTILKKAFGTLIYEFDGDGGTT